jgi:hypothetical protein
LAAASAVGSRGATAGLSQKKPSVIASITEGVLLSA